MYINQLNFEKKYYVPYLFLEHPNHNKLNNPVMIKYLLKHNAITKEEIQILRQCALTKQPIPCIRKQDNIDCKKIYHTYVRYLILHPLYLLQPIKWDKLILISKPYALTQVSSCWFNNPKCLNHALVLQDLTIHDKEDKEWNLTKHSNIYSFVKVSFGGFHISFLSIITVVFLYLLYRNININPRKNHMSYNINNSIRIKLLIYNFGFLVTTAYILLFIACLDRFDDTHAYRQIIPIQTMNTLIVTILFVQVIDILLNKNNKLINTRNSL